MTFIVAVKDEIGNTNQIHIVEASTEDEAKEKALIKAGWDGNAQSLLDGEYTVSKPVPAKGYK